MSGFIYTEDSTFLSVASWVRVKAERKAKCPSLSNFQVRFSTSFLGNDDASRREKKESCTRGAFLVLFLRSLHSSVQNTCGFAKLLPKTTNFLFRGMGETSAGCVRCSSNTYIGVYI